MPNLHERARNGVNKHGTWGNAGAAGPHSFFLSARSSLHVHMSRRKLSTDADAANIRDKRVALLGVCRIRGVCTGISMSDRTRFRRGMRADCLADALGDRLSLQLESEMAETGGEQNKTDRKSHTDEESAATGVKRLPPVHIGALRRQLRPIANEFLEDLQIPAFLRRQLPTDATSVLKRMLSGDASKQSPISVNDQVAKDQNAQKPALRSASGAGPSGSLSTRTSLRKHGIRIRLEQADYSLAKQHLATIVIALEEAAAYDYLRHHNQPPPALWVGRGEYEADTKILLAEFSKLREFLDRQPKAVPARELDAGASLAVIAAKKFVESYAASLGKGAAALTIAATAGLFLALGVDKGTVRTIWNLLHPTK